MAHRRIVIITAGPPCRNPRPVKEAETLGRAGYDVTLLTPHTNPVYAELDGQITAGAPYRHLRTQPRFPLVERAFSHLARGLANRGLPGARALGPRNFLTHLANRLPADLVIVHTEVPFIIGRSLARRGIKVAADFEDWHSQDLLPADRRRRPLAFLARVERDLIHAAAFTTTTSQALSDGLHGAYGGRPAHILANAFPLQPDPHRPRPATAPSFVWFSQTVGAGRGLEAFLSCWARLSRPSTVTLVGEVGDGYREKLTSLVPGPLRGRLRFQASVPGSQLPSLLAQHDLGLALEDAAIRNRDLTITNKILQYLNAGLAIVATPTKGQAEVLQRARGAGILLPAGGGAREVLDALLADPVRLQAMGRDARLGAEREYCWEQQAPRLLGWVAEAVG
jgi:glycosyltransferase involved in cell wall biosynthesis